MPEPARGIAAFALAAALVPAATRAAVPASPPSPQTVLARYEIALAKVATPKVLSFEYAISQLGARNMEQSHRVYRSGLSERDETLVVDGEPLGRVRIIANRTNRYDVRAIAPKPGDYAFAFVGTAHVGDRAAHVFRTRPRAGTDFVVDEVAIDDRSFLPLVVRFRIAGSGARGHGSLHYARAERYWVVREAEVTARLANGSTARERIVWSKYRFPDALPPSTFESPRLLPRDRALPVPEPPAPANDPAGPQPPPAR